MKHWLFLFLSASLIMATSCHKKKPQAPLKFEEPVKQPEVQDDPPVPFTRDLYNRIVKANIDLRKVQFYNDQEVRLSRNLDKNNLTVEDGKIKFLDGKYVNEVLIKQYTKGGVDSIDSDGMRVKFDKSGSTFKFINNKYSPDFFIFSGSNWKDGSCDVLYDKVIYRASCGTCTSVADVKLVVKQSTINDLQKKEKVLDGFEIH